MNKSTPSTTPTRRHALRISLAVVAAALAPVAAVAQAYPTRPITFVVPFAAGGPSDIIARIVAEGMSKHLGQSIVIENVGGAGGTTGSAKVATATPDGYTLLAGSMGSHVAAPVLQSSIKYDPGKDFEAVGLTLNAPAVVVIKKDHPANTIKEFVAYLKANGDKVSQGHGGVGASSHMACLLFNAQAGVKPSVVAYRGSGPALNDVVSGQIDFVCDQTMGVAGQVQAGTVKALVVAGSQRSPAMPNVPTAKEAGMPQYDLDVWSGIFAPKGTPADVIARLNAALDKALDDPGVRERLEKLGGSIPVKANRPSKHLARLVQSEMTRWNPILKTAAATVAGKSEATPGAAPAAPKSN